MPKKTPIELDDLFRLKVVGRPAMSPKGDRIAFEMKRFDLKENKNFTQLMIVDVESGELRELTSGKHSDTQPRWSPDGKRLAFISNRDKGSCLFGMTMDGGEARRITDPDGFVHDFAWSPNGRTFVYSYQAMNEREKLERDGKDDEVKRMPQYKHITRLFHKLDGAGWWNGEFTHIWTVSADGGKPKQLTRGDFDDREPRFSPNGKTISFVANREEGPDTSVEFADVFTVSATGGAIKKVTQMSGPSAGHSWSPDGKWIAFVGSSTKVGEYYKHLERVWIVPSNGGKAKEVGRSIDNHFRNLNLGDVTSAGFAVNEPSWSSDGNRIVFPVSEDGCTRLYSCSANGDDVRCDVGGDINVIAWHRAEGDGPIALSIGTVTDPGDIYVALPGSYGKPRRLTHVNRELLDRRHVGEPEAFKVKSDSVQIPTWVIKPPGFNSKKKYPAILQIHGGPGAHFGAGFFHEMQWMAAQGYVVVYSNPRGGTSYGLKFQNCIHADWGNLDYKDVTRVADWMFAQKYIDKKRIGVTGGSYGGFMTNWLIGHTNRFRAAVTQRSVTNMESMFGTSDFGFEFHYELGGLPWKNVKDYRRMSPLTYAPKINTPLLIEHEEQDHRCPIEQAEQLFTTLKVLGKTVELVRFEGESHGMCRGGRPQNRRERLKRIVGWFDKYMTP